MSKHTPGPWEMGYAKVGERAIDQMRRIEGRDGHAIVVAAPAHPPQVSGDVYIVAMTGTALDSDAEASEANAALIAAAPTLLHTLEQIRDTTECARTRVLAATALEDV